MVKNIVYTRKMHGENRIKNKSKNVIKKSLQTGTQSKEKQQIPAMMTILWPLRRNLTYRDRHQTHQEDLEGYISWHKLGKTVDGWEREKNSVRQSRVCSAQARQSETIRICEFCVAPLHNVPHFEKHHILKHYQSICVHKKPKLHHGTTITAQKCKQKNVLVSNNTWKMSRNWNRKLKGHTSMHCVKLHFNNISAL